MRTIEYTFKISDERAMRIAAAVGIQYSRHLGVHIVSQVKRRKLDALVAAGFDVAGAKRNGVPRFQRNGGPLVLLSTALLIADAFVEGTKAPCHTA